MRFVLLLATSGIVASMRFLAYNPQFLTSHVNFISKLADALISEGHEVVMVSPRTETTVGTPQTRARVLEVAQSPEAAAFEVVANAGLASVWKSSDILTEIKMQYRPMFSTWVRQCNSMCLHCISLTISVTLHDTALLEVLKKEKFDAGFTESFDVCGYAILYLLGIEKYATTVSLATLDGHFGITQVPVNTAYVPSMMGGKFGASMTLWERFLNTLTYRAFDGLLEEIADQLQDLANDYFEQPPDVREVMANTSLVFFNSDPLADFPKLTSPRAIDIGGISVHSGYKSLDEYWSSVLDLHPRTILLSFGTFVKAHLMPLQYRNSIRKALAKFPDVTFVVKYENVDHHFSDGLPNVVETTWAPQHDMLHDPRLTAFITHGGQGSITEASEAGVPLVCIPVTADQFRNARQVERNGVGVMLSKEELAEPARLEEAISTILTDESYRLNARKLAQTIADRPFSMKDVFVRNMEFLAKHGPLRRLDHIGSKFSSIQYYLLDLIFTITFVVIIIALLMLVAIRRAVNYLRRITARKVKSN